MKLKNFGLKKGGFTLIELLVVIVIIGILATISVAQFNSYFAKARDAERQSAIRSMSTIMQTARATEVITAFNDMDPADGTQAPTAINLPTFMISEGGYSVPAGKSDFDYFYVHGDSAAGNQEFAFVICKEDGYDNDGTTGYFIQGSGGAVKAVADLDSSDKVCAEDTANVADGFTTAVLAADTAGYSVVEVITAP